MLVDYTKAQVDLGTGTSFSFAYVNDIHSAERLRDGEGFVPVELTIGNKSIVDRFELDHHNGYARNGPVAMRAADIAIARKKRGEGYIDKIQSTGRPDSDVIYAPLVLSGSLEPDRRIASAIGTLDTDPLGIDRTRDEYIRCVAFDEMLGTPERNVGSFVKAFGVGFDTYDFRRNIDGNTLRRALDYERNRIAGAATEVKEFDGKVAFVVSSGHVDTPHFNGKTALVVRYNPTIGNITFRGLTPEAARRMIKPDIYSLTGSKNGLEGELYLLADNVLGMPNGSSGGRDDIGGSSQGGHFSEDDGWSVFRAFAEKINGMAA